LQGVQEQVNAEGFENHIATRGAAADGVKGRFVNDRVGDPEADRGTRRCQRIALLRATSQERNTEAGKQREYRQNEE
jgi:hypothetical protein